MTFAMCGYRFQGNSGALEIAYIDTWLEAFSLNGLNKTKETFERLYTWAMKDFSDGIRYAKRWGSLTAMGIALPIDGGR